MKDIAKKLEQHPDESERPINEEGIHLTRKKPDPGKPHYGPPSSVPLTLAQQSKRAAQLQAAAAKGDPRSAMLKIISKAGLPDPYKLALKYGPRVLDYTGEKGGAYKAWQAQKQAAEAGGEALDDLARQLRRRANGDILWSD